MWHIGTSYRYFTSLEDAKCTAEGEPAYMGILKRSFCSVQVAGRECENDKFCGEGEICLCNTKCQSYRCIKGKRKEDKPTVEGNNGGWNSTKNTTEGKKRFFKFLYLSIFCHALNRTVLKIHRLIRRFE